MRQTYSLCRRFVFDLTPYGLPLILAPLKKRPATDHPDEIGFHGGDVDDHVTAKASVPGGQPVRNNWRPRARGNYNRNRRSETMIGS